MTRPLVSVLIPSYNAESYIGETLESVFRQTWPNIEIIVVDDGSTDQTREEISRFNQTNLRILSQHNLGAGAARNQAFQAAHGEYIQYLDADDLIDPDKIERQMARLINHPGAVASGEWGRFYTNATETHFDPEPVWRDLDPLEWLILSRQDGLGMLLPAMWLIPRSIAESAGRWNETLSLGDDGEYFTRVLLRSTMVLFCAGARCRYRSGVPGNLSGARSHQAWASGFQVLDLCQSHVQAHEDSERVRRGFALSWQHLAHAAYPYDPELAERALGRARALHSVTIQPGGGARFKIASQILGWRTARRLQVASGRP